MKIGSREFDIKNNTYVVGILNVTPDSFSDGGRFVVSNGEGAELSQVLRACDSMLASGADIIDIGGESTKPGTPRVSAEEEMERIIPVIEAVKRRFGAVISVDTYKAEVAAEAVRAGAVMINDVWGLKGDKLMSAAVAEIMRGYDNIGLCIMHNRRPAVSEGSDTDDKDVPITMHGEDVDYGYRQDPSGNVLTNADLFMEDVRSDLEDSLKLASDAGIDPGRIIIDPGVGFAKTYEQNLTVMKRINELRHLRFSGTQGTEYEFPLLLGSSRKSVIGKVLNRETDGRLYGTLATTALAVTQGVAFVRVHDVAANAEVIKMLKAIERGM